MCFRRNTAVLGMFINVFFQLVFLFSISLIKTAALMISCRFYRGTFFNDTVQNYLSFGFSAVCFLKLRYVFP